MLVAEKTVDVREPLLQGLAKARARTDEIFALIRPDSLYERPVPERHRIVFYIGHLEAFDWNLLHERMLALPAFHPQFDRLFAFGIDPVGRGLPTDQASDWPPIGQVREYADRVRRELDDRLGSVELGDPASRQWMHVAIEHRLMHAETLAYMLHQLPLDRKIRQAQPLQPSTPAIKPAMVEIPAGAATLGLRRDASTFGWDNEFEAHTVHVPAFTIDRYKVTNGQYLEFIAADGYADRSLWTEADWEWKTANDIAHPIFWLPRDRRWLYRTMFDEVPLPLDWPAYVSLAEARAYARWAGKELPSEAQWQRAAYATPKGVERQYPWGEEPPDGTRGNFDFQRWDPVAVNAHSAGDSAFGISDLVGNGWEWTSTPFAPFPGFELFPFYPGYSADFFDGRHYVLKGGSARTAACMLRRSFRNWFQPHYPYVYAAFRCVTR